MASVFRQRCKRLYCMVIMSLLSIAVGLSMAAVVVHFESVHCLSTAILSAGPDEQRSCTVSEMQANDSLCEGFIAMRRQIYTERTYGTKTGYMFAEENIGDETEVLNGCSIVQVYGVYRHGARMPGKSHIKDFSKLQQLLTTLTASIPISGMSDKVKEVIGWTNPFIVQAASELSDEGMMEQYCLAKRLKTRFPGLLNGSYITQLYDIQSTYKERSISSALSFAHGLFEGHGPLNGYQPFVLNINSQNDSILRFFDACDKYVQYMEENKTVEDFVRSFNASSSMSSALSNIQRRIDPDGGVWNLTVDHAEWIYRACSMEMANFGRSKLCALLSKADNDVFEYWNDLKQYTTKGYGDKFNWKITCKLLSDIQEKFSSYVNGSSTPAVYLRFAHAETLIPMVSALGLYKDDVPLLPSNYESHKNRLFCSANFAPFSGNLLFALYRCSTFNGSKYLFRILLNEKVIPINHTLCDAQEPYLCPFQDFETILNDISTEKLLPCSYGEFC